MPVASVVSVRFVTGFVSGPPVRFTLAPASARLVTASTTVRWIWIHVEPAFGGADAGAMYVVFVESTFPVTVLVTVTTTFL